MNSYEHCDLCPRLCGIDRRQTAGRCGCTEKAVIAHTMLHEWEEPCISGKSGAIFFAGCTLGCVYCQNKDISAVRYPEKSERFRTIDAESLAKIMLTLEEKGADNINFVSPTQFSPTVREAVLLYRQKSSAPLPIVYNTGGYERAEIVRCLADTVDIWLTDVKYHSPALSESYSAAANYFDAAADALAEMLRITGAPVFENRGDSETSTVFDGTGIPPAGMLKRGVIVRHLVLPGSRQDSIAILNALKERFGTEAFLLSIMSQYTPGFADESRFPALRRRVTGFEYDSVVKEAVALGFTGYIQERTAADKNFVPKWGENEA